MKTLKESILSDIEDTLQSGDDYIKTINGELKEINKLLKSRTKWDRHFRDYPVYNNQIGIPNLLKNIGFDADGLGIVVHTGNPHKDAFEFKIVVLLFDDINTMRYKQTGAVYIDTSKYDFNGLLTGLFDPATKSPDMLKRFLDNMIAKNGQLIGDVKELLKIG